ncbi:MAG: hypothetical protein M3Y27_17755 [Acidobacteriota bacterium]|nr:hypothetical protein [Acidobacteriota bacterium]
MAVPFLDRSAIENLFGIRRRRAHALMSSFGGYQVGKTFLIDRAQLLTALESVASGNDFKTEHRRKARISDCLEEIRGELRGRKIVIPAPPDARESLITDLPAGIHLRPGELCIEFSGTEDLLSKLFELSQGILNDWERFQKMIGAL